MGFVVLGSGAVGKHVARLLADRGETVTIVSKSGKPIQESIHSISANITDRSQWAMIDPSPQAIVNALNPPHYNKWPQEFPPLGTAANEFAFQSGCPVVHVSNLYMYAPSVQPLSPSSALATTGKKALLRQEMWEETLSYAERGLSVAEVRGSDYINSGPQSPLGERFVPLIKKGKSPSVIGGANLKHSWTAPVDVARTAIAILDQKKFGRPWHVPTNDPFTFQEVADQIAQRLNQKQVQVKTIPTPIFSMLALFNPIVKELRETLFQFSNPFLIDSSETEKELNLKPTSWNILVDDLVDSYN